jgi:hypothetical protein
MPLTDIPRPVNLQPLWFGPDYWCKRFYLGNVNELFSRHEV